MKIALVHDYLVQDGGAERVLKAFHEIWPEAPIFVLFHKKGNVQGFEGADVRETFIARFPFAKTRYRWLLPLMPLATESHQLTGFDVVLSSTSAFAKGVITSPSTVHISYCHTPTRYLWTDTRSYIETLKCSGVVKKILPRLLHHLRIWDRSSADRVDHFIANSQTVRRRISKFYRKSSDVLHPPVDTHLFSVRKETENYFVAGGRLVPYKRFDLLVYVFNRLGWDLRIFGSGPEMRYLEKIAKSNITFLGRVSDGEKARLLSGARGFLHPQLEDLGITPIEAMASGCPVIAYGHGGVTETVVPGKTGVFFEEQSWESLLDTLLSFDSMTWDRDAIALHAERFNMTDFKERIATYVYKKYAESREQSVFESSVVR